jgi:hypothetical protein
MNSNMLDMNVGLVGRVGEKPLKGGFSTPTPTGLLELEKRRSYALAALSWRMGGRFVPMEDVLL